MKYRIRKENDRYRAEISKENKFGKLNWTPIEDDNEDLCARTILYDTIEDAEIACKAHHIKRGYDKIEGENVVRTFDL